MIKQLACLLFAFAAAAAFAAVDVNKADQAALESLKGIGPSASVRILDERKKAPFKNWADLTNRVKGIKEHKAAKLSKEGLTVNGESYQASPAPAVLKKQGKK